MNAEKDTTQLQKRPTWFLYLLANVLVVLGCAITWILIKRSGADFSLFWLPTLICNLLAIIAAGFFMWLEARDLAPKVMHFQRKWLKWYIVAMSMFVAAILFNVLYYMAFLVNQIPSIVQTKANWQLIIYLVITGVLTILAIGFQRYARFRIDLDIYRRRHGEEIKDNKEVKAEPVKEEKPVEEVKKDKPENDLKPTGGLLDQMDK